MLVITVVFGVVIVFCFIILLFCVNKILELNDQIEELGVQVEESLDIIDAAYQKINHITHMNVLSDEPVVKSFVKEVKNTQNAVLLIANKLTSFDHNESDDK